MEKTYKAEPYRYLANAREILSTKAKKQGKLYSDAKYVRMACNTAYSGLLLALDDLFEYKGIKAPKKTGRPRAVDVKFYRDNIAKMNKTKLKEFNEAYNLLHLYGGYDGSLAVSVSQDGLSFSTSIIDWIYNTQIK